MAVASGAITCSQAHITSGEGALLQGAQRATGRSEVVVGGNSFLPAALATRGFATRRVMRVGVLAVFQLRWRQPQFLLVQTNQGKMAVMALGVWKAENSRHSESSSRAAAAARAARRLAGILFADGGRWRYGR